MAWEGLADGEYVQPIDAEDLGLPREEGPIVGLTLEEVSLDALEAPVHVQHLVDVHLNRIDSRKPQLKDRVTGIAGACED